MTGINSVGTYGLSGSSWWYSRKTSSAGAVEPVTPAKAVNPLPTSEANTGARVPASASAASTAPAAAASQPESVTDLLRRYESDPVGMAVRQRIQYVNGEQAAQASGAQAVEAGEKTKSAAEVMEESECQTCAKRKYQDGSDDPGVSFKTAAHIAPENAAAVVRGHEQEHVVREQAAAQREGRKVVQQSVTLHTDICPECGKVYISGGTTRTATVADNSAETSQNDKQEPYSLFDAVA